MSPGSVYQNCAEECRRTASSAATEALKASWLALADAWTKLAAWTDRREDICDPKTQLLESDQQRAFCVAAIAAVRNWRAADQSIAPASVTLVRARKRRALTD